MIGTIGEWYVNDSSDSNGGDFFGRCYAWSSPNHDDFSPHVVSERMARRSQGALPYTPWTPAPARFLRASSQHRGSTQFPICQPMNTMEGQHEPTSHHTCWFMFFAASYYIFFGLEVVAKLSLLHLLILSKSSYPARHDMLGTMITIGPSQGNPDYWWLPFQCMQTYIATCRKQQTNDKAPSCPLLLKTKISNMNQKIIQTILKDSSTINLLNPS